MGEHVAQQLESLHELVPPGPLGSDGAERERADHRSLHRQRDRDLRLDAEAAVGLAVDPGVVFRELVDPREPNQLAAAEAGHHPGDLLESDRGRLRPHSVGHPPVRDPGGPAVVRVLGEVAPVHSEQIGDPAQRALDLSIDVRGRDTAEGRNLLRQQGLELESLAEEHLGAAPSGPLEQEPDGEQERAEHESRAHGDLPDDPLTRHFLKL